MKLLLKTRVEQSPREVWSGFDESLFLKLAPPFPRTRLLKFEGSTTGCWVEVEINFVVFKQTWQSLIVAHEESEQTIWFIDEGRKLPFFLKYWRHRHLMEADGTGTIITDDIEYRSPTSIFDILLYPSLWLQFAYRKPIYRRVFARKKANLSHP